MRDEFGSLPGKDEVAACLCSPGFYRFQAWCPVKDSVQLRGGELSGIILKAVFCQKTPWKEWPAPGVVMPSRRPDQNARHCRSRKQQATGLLKRGPLRRSPSPMMPDIECLHRFGSVLQRAFRGTKLHFAGPRVTYFHLPPRWVRTVGKPAIAGCVPAGNLDQEIRDNSMVRTRR